MSVNMLSWRVTIDLHPRSKNGHPPQITTGVASANSIQFRSRWPVSVPSGSPGSSSEIMNTRIGTVRISPARNRRVMSSSSGLRSFAVTTRGSSAMPQIGQLPGRSRTISGCIGHVQVVAVTGRGIAGSSAIPHFGQAPG
jgi:hypothetical protein